MSKNRTATALAVLAVPLALSLGACGNGDDTKASKAISDSIMKQQAGSTSSILSMKRKDATCIGDGFVDKIRCDDGTQENGTADTVYFVGWRDPLDVVDPFGSCEIVEVISYLPGNWPYGPVGMPDGSVLALRTHAANNR